MDAAIGDCSLYYYVHLLLSSPSFVLVDVSVVTRLSLLIEFNVLSLLSVFLIVNFAVAMAFVVVVNVV